MRRLSGLLLTCGATCGVLVIVATLVSMLFSITPLVVTSGSMGPAMPEGSVALARSVPASHVEHGDVVSVVRSDGVRVTHRVVGKEVEARTASLILQGDENVMPDPEAYVAAEVDRVFLDVPSAGYVLLWLSSAPGLMSLMAVLVMVMLLGFQHDGRRGGRRKRRRRAPAVILGLLVAMMVMVAVPSAASFADTARVTSGPVQSTTVLPPTTVECSGGGLLASLTFTWPNRDVRYAYVVTLESPVGTVRRTDVVGNNGVQGSNQSITYSFTLLNGLLGLPANLTVRVRSRLSSATSWTSAGDATDTGQLLSLGLIGLGSSC